MGRSRRGKSDWVFAALGALATLSGFAALAFVPGVSRPYVLAASTLVVVFVNLNLATGWALPDLPARLLNVLILLVLLASAGLRATWGADADLSEAAHVLILLIVLRTFQRKRPRDDFFLLVGVGVSFAVASARVTSPLFLPIVLVGMLASAGGAVRLVFLGERAVAPRRLLVEGRSSSGPAATAGRLLHTTLISGWLALLLVAVGTAVFLLVPRPRQDDGETDGLFGNRPPGIAAEGSSAPVSRRSSRTGFSPEVVLGDIGRIKQDMRIAFLARIYRDRESYRLAPHEAYWRGMVLTHTDGIRWLTPERPTGLIEGGATRRGSFLEIEPYPGGGYSSVHRIEQEIALAEMPGTSILFALWRPWLVDPGSTTEVRLRPGGTLSLDRPHAESFGYTVQSLQPRDGVEDPWSETLGPAERSVLLRTPRDQRRLRELAAQVTGDSVGQEAGRRIREHLRERCRYTLDLPKLSRDRPLDDFLFRTREGHCELFASAMALMLRARGIPSRLVTGFRGYEWSDEKRIHTVRFSDAHAWVEAFYPGRGWVVEDATPGDETAGLPVPHDTASGTTGEDDPEPAVDVVPLPERVLTFGREDQRELMDAARGAIGWVGRAVSGPRGAPVLLAALGILGAWTCVRLLRRRRTRTARPGSGRPATSGPGGDAVRRAYLSMVSILARRGIRRAVSETPRELAGRAGRQLPEAAEPVLLLTDLHQVVCYGERTADRADGRRASELVTAVKRGASAATAD